MRKIWVDIFGFVGVKMICCIIGIVYVVDLDKILDVNVCV